jgi:hypothetical protein
MDDGLPWVMDGSLPMVVDDGLSGIIESSPYSVIDHGLSGHVTAVTCRSVNRHRLLDALLNPRLENFVSLSS